jgi:hypothetical protein
LVTPMLGKLPTLSPTPFWIYLELNSPSCEWPKRSWNKIGSLLWIGRCVIGHSFGWIGISLFWHRYSGTLFYTDIRRTSYTPIPLDPPNPHGRGERKTIWFLWLGMINEILFDRYPWSCLAYYMGYQGILYLRGKDPRSSDIYFWFLFWWLL